MIEIGVFHNGASDLPPVRTRDGTVCNDGSLAEVHAAAQRTIVNQVRQGILADRLGFDYWFQTEHHFQPEGAEMSPNPLASEMAIAANTRRIRLGQAANIITWHHPVRLAEMAAMLDVVSGGRVEVGVGRGYQPRESEVFGRPYGSTIQDQERNRVAFHEALDILIKCWTEPSFSHRDEFFSIPPRYTKWNHKQTIAYYGLDKVERNVEDVLSLGPPDMYSAGSPVLATTTTLREISVFPQPLQKPYPQLWEPLTSPRSIRFCAERGVNGYFIVEPNSRLKQNVEMYYEDAERAGWPDRLQRGAFKYGWDCDKRRGIVTCRYIHLLLPGMDRDKELERLKFALEVQWDYYGPFGFAALVSEAGEDSMDLRTKIRPESLLAKDIALFGTPAEVVEKIMRTKEYVGYDDFMFHAWFELAGFQGAEIEDQMYYFAEECMPLLDRACGGRPPPRTDFPIPSFDDVRAAAPRRARDAFPSTPTPHDKNRHDTRRIP
ncbi:MAG TPA: LLM class flavin-dependent oxidoreductase [Gammaproteobacteria bacterium]|nr:LLM class flavin-dependent oxidoreductase [Gammaproteobacteria bacterium]